MTVLNGLDKQMARCAEKNQSCSQANQSPCLQMSHRVERWGQINFIIECPLALDPRVGGMPLCACSLRFASLFVLTEYCIHMKVFI